MSRAVGIVSTCAVLVLAALVYTCRDLETPASVFGTYEEARRTGAIGPGKWLPSWLPVNATEIHESHSIDTNQVWLEFKSAGSLTSFGQECLPIDHRSAQAALPNLTSGFPRSMRSNEEQLRNSTELEVVRCEDVDVKREWIVIRRSGSDLFYAWTSHQP